MHSALLGFTLLFAGSLSAQFVEIDQLPSYTHSVYLDLATRSTKSVENTDWDIAFNVGSRSSSILVNETVLSSRSDPQREVELYGSTATDFATADTSMITGRLLNGEGSWDEGAFGLAAAPGDPFDVGWGTYSPATQTVSGNKVFFLATRDGVYHKLLIQSLAGGEYTFVHGPLDGSTVDTVTIDKTDFPGKTLVHYSLERGVMDLEPASWDLMFTRYSTSVAFGDDFLDYTVTGVLQNQGVRVAQIPTDDPATTAVPEADSLYTEELDVIGWDWKEVGDDFRFFTYDTIAYFAETADSTYRIVFYDFTGASLGVSTLTVEGFDRTTSVGSLPTGVSESKLYPNPAPGDRSILEFDLRAAARQSELTIYDPAGRVVSVTRPGALPTGRNRVEVPLAGLPAGQYFVRLSGDFGFFTHHLVK